MKRKERIKKLLAHLAEGIFDKDDILALGLLAAVSGESIFLLGPPGVAKSLLARKLKYAFCEGKSFEYLMSRFSTPDEIFGPISIRKLKEEDKYERITAKYLPDANVVFLDEIWKASSAIQNALLTILNERIYRNGEQELQVNIRCIISASNELPQLGEGLEALWDRFLIRSQVSEIRNPQSFLQMITSNKDAYTDTVPTELKLSEIELEEWSAEIDTIDVPEVVLNVIQILKHKIEEYNEHHNPQILVYDRRWKKIIRLLRTSAFLNERKQVDLMDCFLMVHCLWNTPEQIPAIFQILSEIIREHGYHLTLHLGALSRELQEFEQDVRNETLIAHQVVVEEMQSVDTEFLEVLNIRNYFEGNLIKKADFVKLNVEEWKSISLFDMSHNLVNKIQAKLALQKHTLEILHNSQVIPLKIKTVEREKIEYIKKKPHSLVEKFWNEKAQELKNYIQSQQKRLQEDAPDELNHLKNNLFVPAHLSEIVEANMKESSKILQNLALQLEKIVHLYE
ncbi:AAA family ATPase [Raineya sp.]|jgi:MoxR-like ATPase